MLLLAAALALVIGLTLGLLGGGGSILTLPVLVYVLDVEAKQAIASSLIVVGATALAGAIAHARAGNVDYRTGALFGAAGMAGAFAGGRGAGRLPGDALLGAFAAVMLVTAIAMMRPRSEPSGEQRRASAWRVVAAGLAAGALSGLVGAGGGFLVVPALVLFGGLGTRRAIGTSLMVIALQSAAGFAGHAAHTRVDWPLIALIAGVAVAGSVAGTRLADRMRPAVLRGAFAWLVLAMAIFMVGRQISPIAAAAAGALSIAVITFLHLRGRARQRSSLAMKHHSGLEQRA